MHDGGDDGSGPESPLLGDGDNVVDDGGAAGHRLDSLSLYPEGGEGLEHGMEGKWEEGGRDISFHPNPRLALECIYTAINASGKCCEGVEDLGGTV